MALSLEFNLRELLDSFSESQRSRYISVINDDSVKTEFARRVISRIKERTQEKNIDKNGRRFVGYSKAYINSDDFKIFGKSASKVTLKLSGEMQASIFVGKRKRNKVSISISDEDQIKKARGHINGSNNLPVRDFWGLPKKDQVSILKDVLSSLNLDQDIFTISDAISAAAAGRSADFTTSSDGVEISNTELALLSGLISG